MRTPPAHIFHDIQKILGVILFGNMFQWSRYTDYELLHNRNTLLSNESADEAFGVWGGKDRMAHLLQSKNVNTARVSCVSYTRTAEAIDVIRKSSYSGYQSRIINYSQK
jgi:hypothetical protein